MILWLLNTFSSPLLAIVTLLLCLVAANAGLLWVRTRISHDVLRQSNDVSGIIFSMFGVVYAIILAFVVVTVWQQFTDANSIVEREAAAMGDLFQDMEALRGDHLLASDLVQRGLQCYAEEVLNNEWVQMRSERMAPEADQVSDQIWNILVDIKPDNDADSNWHSEIISRANDFRGQRRARAIHIHDQIPFIMWAMLLVGGIGNIIYAYFLGMSSTRGHVALVSALTAMLSLLLFLILVLDHPFAGDISVSKEPFETELATFTAALGDPCSGEGNPDALASARTSSTIKIVSSLPRTGAEKASTDSQVNAIRMAIDEVQGKIGKWNLQYLDLDDGIAERNGGWDEGKEVANAKRAAGDPDVMLYIGPNNSGAAKVSIPILNDATMAMISPSATYAGLTKPGKGLEGEPHRYYPTFRRNFTRMLPADDLQGRAAASFARNQLHTGRVYILHDGDVYGTGITRVFANYLKRDGVFVAGGPEAITPKAADYRALAAKIKATNPDLVYYGGTTANGAVQLWKDLRAALGPDIPLMGPDGIFEDALLQNAGDAAAGSYFTYPGLLPSQLEGAGKQWYEAYKQRFGSEPAASTPYTYEAVKVALEAIRTANVHDRDAIRRAIFATRNFQGILGTWSFDANGDTSLTDISFLQAAGPSISEARALGVWSPK